MGISKRTKSDLRKRMKKIKKMKKISKMKLIRWTTCLTTNSGMRI